MPEFIIRAIVIGVCISLTAGLVGVPLVLKRKSMIGDGLSHVGFSAFALASVLGLAPVEFAIPLVILASVLILRLGEKQRMSGDASIAVISASALALGVLIVSLNGVNVDINSYLFGSVLATDVVDVIISVVLAVLTTILYIVFYRRIFAITFDERFARASGMKVDIYNIGFAALSSVVIVLGMKIMGALLVSSLLIFPTLAMKYVFKSFRGVVIASAIYAVVGFLIGFTLSYIFNTPTGATIVLTEAVGLIISYYLSR